MSVILTTPDNYETIAKTISYLRQQTVKKSLEIVIIAPSASEITDHIDKIDDFYAIRIIEIGEIKSIGFCYAQGIRYSQADIVALAEDHSFPDSDWAQYLIKAHEQPWAVVGSVIKNANPDNFVSQVDMLGTFSNWLDSTPSGIMNSLPFHSSYKKKVLLSYGEKLEKMMENDLVLHWDLRNKGYELYLESRAKTSHINIGNLLVWFKLQFYFGRVFAYDRANNENWHLPKKIFYVTVFPLIPFIHFGRIYKKLQECQLQNLLSFKLCLTLFSGLIINAIGQAIGYISEIGHTRLKLSKFYFHRELYS